MSPWLLKISVQCTAEVRTVTSTTLEQEFPNVFSPRFVRHILFFLAHLNKLREIHNEVSEYILLESADEQHKNIMNL